MTADLWRIAFFGRPILHDPHGDVGTHRTFKGAFIVTWFTRLDRGEPHLRFAKFAKGPPDDPAGEEYDPFACSTFRVAGAAYTNWTLCDKRTKEKGHARGPARPFS